MDLRIHLHWHGPVTHDRRSADYLERRLTGPSLTRKELLLVRKRLTTSCIWLGLFAMLMIHVGPLYSALQMAQASVAPQEQHVHAGHAEPDAGGHGHHRQSPGEPAWLAALELCGYCELLTLNPPLSLSVDLVLPRHEPERFASLPTAPLLPMLRHGGSHARAPPGYFHS